MSIYRETEGAPRQQSALVQKLSTKEFNMFGVLTVCLALSCVVAFPNGYNNGYGYNNGFGNQYGYNKGFGNQYGYNNWFGNQFGDRNGFDSQYDNMNYGDGCSNDWRMYNDHYYCFNRYSMPWYRAQESCRNMNGYLVQVENMEENQWLSNMVGSQSYWMGAYCNGGSCMSSDESWFYGNDNSQMSYFNWGEGNDFYRNGGYGNECCGMFNWNNGGQWWRYMCQEPMMYICEREQQYEAGKR